MENPFEVIDRRLSNIERLLLDIKHKQPEATHFPQTEHENVLFGDKAAAKYIGCTILQVANLRKEGAIAVYPSGRRYFYKAKELEWIKRDGELERFENYLKKKYGTLPTSAD